MVGMPTSFLNGPSRPSFRVRVAVWAVVCWCQLAHIHAQSPPIVSEGSADEARRLIEAGAAAIQAKNFAAAEMALQQALLTNPSVKDSLLRLGELAEAQGASILAADYYQRFLDLAGQASGGQFAHARLTSFITAQRPQAALLRVVVDERAWLRVDGRLVAQGLADRPVDLLLPPGEHQIVAQMAAKTVTSGHYSYRRGRSAVLDLGQGELGPSSPMPIVRPLVALLAWVKSGAGGAAALAENSRLTEAMQSGANATNLQFDLVLASEVAAAVNRTPLLSECLETVACQSDLLRMLDSDVLVVMQRSHSQMQPGGGSHMTLHALHLQHAGVLSVSAETTGDLPAQASELTRQVLGQALARALAVQVTSSPSDAQLTIDGRAVGRTPFWGTILSGEHRVDATRAGYATEMASLVVPSEMDRPLEVALTLRSMTLKRPVWRLTLGGVLLGSGLFLGGVGISGLITAGRCKDPGADPTGCTPYYDTGPTGGALLGVGAALTITGVVLLALPPKAPSMGLSSPIRARNGPKE